MKNIFKFLFFSIFLIVFMTNNGYSQIIKVHKKQYKKSVKEKSKEFRKKGYRAKGAGNLKIYVTDALNKEFEVDEDGIRRNTVVYTSAVDPTFEGAVTACRAGARVAIAGNIETRVAELVKRNLNNDQISAKSASGINQTIVAGKQLIAQRVSIMDIYILFREVIDENDGKTLLEVEYAAFYNNELAIKQAYKYIREELKNESEELHKDLDEIFNIKE